MVILMPYCSFKCGKDICQNKGLSETPNINIEVNEIVNIFKSNSLLDAVVFGGLEPFDSWPDLKDFIHKFRAVSDADIVIYTGYEKEELLDRLLWLMDYPNVIVKFGRYKTNNQPHFDDVLGVYLSSNNQYAERIT